MLPQDEKKKLYWFFKCCFMSKLTFLKKTVYNYNRVIANVVLGWAPNIDISLLWSTNITGTNRPSQLPIISLLVFFFIKPPSGLRPSTLFPNLVSGLRPPQLRFFYILIIGTRYPRVFGLVGTHRSPSQTMLHTDLSPT